MRPLPPLNSLRAFEAVARYGTISAAARALNVTHGAVSQQIRNLEVYLGVPLFASDGKRLRLSPQGEGLASQVMQAFDALRSAMQAVGDIQSGDLRITCAPALLSHWLLPALSDFCVQHPRLRLRLYPVNDLDALMKNEVDLSLVYDRPPAELWSQKISSVRLFPIAAPALLQRSPIRRPQDILKHRLIHADKGEEWIEWLTSVGQESPGDRGIHFTNSTLSTEAAIHGLGVGLGDDISVAAFLMDGRLRMPISKSVQMERGYHVVCRRERRHDPLIELTIDWILSLIVLMA